MVNEKLYIFVDLQFFVDLKKGCIYVGVIFYDCVVL